MPNPVVHFEVSSADAEKAQKFYGDLFGWHIDANNPMNYGMVDLGKFIDELPGDFIEDARRFFEERDYPNPIRRSK